MIRKKPKELTPYEKYFMTEAPARRPYMRIISAFPDGRLKRFDTNMDDPDPDTPEEDTGDLDLVDDTDFADNITDDLEAPEPEAQNIPAPEGDAGGLETEPPADDAGTAEPVDTGEDPGAEPTVQGADDATEPVAATDDPPPVEGGDAPVDDAEGGLETEPPAGAEGDVAPTDDTGGEPEAPADDEGGEGGLDTEDNTDFGANMDDGTGGDEGDAETDVGGGDAQAQTPNNAESQLKFSLYRNLKNLYIAIQNYISQLDDLSVSSFNYSMVIKTASKKLGELEDYMYEYMTIRFKDAPYLESMDFYQKCVATLQLIFELLKNNKENGKIKDKTIN